MKECAAKYPESVYYRVCALHNCFGFIDGTKIKMARPIGYCRQRSMYSGHERMHFLSYQTITTPDGLIFHLHGPVEDSRMPFSYRESCLNQVLGQNMNTYGT